MAYEPIWLHYDSVLTSEKFNQKPGDGRDVPHLSHVLALPFRQSKSANPCLSAGPALRPRLLTRSLNVPTVNEVHAA